MQLTYAATFQREHVLNTIKKFKLTTVIFTCVILLGCNKAEPVRDIAYYQGLGSEKSIESLRACAEKKKTLLEKKDAEGLDQFAKSTQNVNCRTAFRYVMLEEAKLITARAAELQKMNTRDEVRKLRETLHAEFEARMVGLVPMIEEWNEEAVPFALAIREFDRQVANRISRIDIDSWKPRRK